MHEWKSFNTGKRRIVLLGLNYETMNSRKHKKEKEKNVCSPLKCTENISRLVEMHAFIVSVELIGTQISLLLSNSNLYILDIVL